MKNQIKKKINKTAVVGMAGVFPQALDTRQFLDNIVHKKNSIIRVPDHRWIGSVNEFISNRTLVDKAVSDKAGLIEDFQFDPHGFLIEKDLLSQLDPLHQLVLHAGREAFSHCFHTKEDKKRTGVILAAIALPTDASSMVSRQILCNKEVKKPGPNDFSNAAVVSFPAAVLARAMGFEGGSFTLDAACASSLYSIKLACEHLHLKKADIMVAGGVSRPDSLYTQIGFSQLQALSPSGRCSPFDKAADGLVVGEGTGIVVLKRLEDAIECKDKIYAVITGAGVSNDIEGTLVGPASEGQVRAMIQAYEQASWSPDDIQYMECHGSGTPVGDQVELTSIHSLLKAFDCPDKHLSIGSVKSMTGHLLTAAGATGFIKTVLSMNEGILPPSLNYSGPSSNSILNNSHIKVQTNVEQWLPNPGNSTRKAGISAFGFGGINAHLLVEEFIAPSTHSSAHYGSTHYSASNIKQTKTLKTIPCAIVGMETIARECSSLSEFKDLILDRTCIKPGLPGSRWRRTGYGALKEIKEKPGFYIDHLSTRVGEFHIPPNQMTDILPQHIFLLKAVKGALEDAKITPRPLPDDAPRHHMGCAIGIEFDYGATDFHLRWKINHLQEALKDKISPPLTFNRTLGALGGIVASRVAREFKLGGPCFTLSAGAASGIKAIETAVHSLSAWETELFICGCVDLAGDIRQFALNAGAKEHSEAILPSEGAAAIVLKRLDQAIEDGDRIYGIITGVAGAGSDVIPGEKCPDPNISETLYARSLETALKDAKTNFQDIDLYEACASGIKDNDTTETRVLNRLCLKDTDQPHCHVTATSPVIGNTRGASALFSVIKTALCLNHRIMPSNKAMQACFEQLEKNRFCFTDTPIKWNKQDKKTPLKACAASMTLDGACAHVILEEHMPKNKSLQDISFLDESEDESDKVTDNNMKPKKELILKTNPKHISEETILKINQHLGTNEKKITDNENKVSDMKQQQLRTDEAIFDQTHLDQTHFDPMQLDPALIADSTLATSRAHEKFLEFSKENMVVLEKQFETMTRLAGSVIHETKTLLPLERPDPAPESSESDKVFESPSPAGAPSPFLDRDQCLEYAVGKAGNVLGKKFEIIDTYPVRVRLPAEPLMLVDRIMDIQGEMLSLTSGKIITQHDVKENAWYLDGGKAPVSISIEAGQADLFLCAWMGIDHVVKGTRKYRLLDAKVTFHRTLPEPGETIEYHIEIDRFLKQGDVYLFFFHYKGYVNDQLLISMKDGCAGFFTEQEVENSGGIILKSEELKQIKSHSKFSSLVPVEKESFSDERIEALRSGNLGDAFGKNFALKSLGKNLKLPGKRMHLIDRVLEFDPCGGRFGLGSIIAQADIHPDNWFLTCHFIDDRVMPGTLMYECCAHALRIFTQRMGWISDRDDVFYDVIPDNESDLKCRGPVTPDTKKARYEIEIKQMGYAPEPYVIADAHMFSDDLRIVLYKNMGLKLAGLTKSELKSFWR
ncbi:beta-ketoacyl synthase N-terminal-like domain-containing protein [Desulfobacula toluolica]|uniref:Putative multi-domain beta-ketoacyl polyketide synthase n=1 Tax=Desulfobacula toluolica (strain DSM 7467 / Tol2) TaxID=651182 RepID=K0NI79_DESTT|nr:beta-ketoacyl synthase N-terminal-like domain-containing protein [Desulfobacula toluolica]CCK80650.1 putative multi-domain beta-ketoacyl polyketide synthase [Desulfobacula toluolica Tol2]